MSELSLVVATPIQLAADWLQIPPAAVEAKEAALSCSAVVGKVTNKNENKLAGEALARLQSLSRGLEAQRKRITDPFVEAQRTAKRIVDEFRDEIDREAARVELLMKDFALEEQRRVREEQQAQQRELERIERERQAELQRIADEQARVEREAREAREAADRLASEAKNKAQREAAAKALEEANAKEREAQAAVALSAQQTQIVNDRADLDLRIEAKPVEVTRAFGQSNRKKWRVTQINDLQLMRARPDLIRRVEWDRVAITEILNAGDKLPGVTAEEDLTISVRSRAPRTIEV